MRKNLTLSAWSIVLASAGVLLPSTPLARWMNPDTGYLFASIVQGITLLKILLVTDAVLLLFIAYQCRKRPHDIDNSTTPPLWSPAIPKRTQKSEASLLWFIPGLVLVGLTLRLIRLDNDLWIDEVLTLVDFVRKDFGVILTYYGSDNNHILYSVLAKAAIALFGESPGWLRLPAVIFGVASIWLTMRLANRTFGWRVAVLSATLLTLSYHHIWFSQNARGYTLLLFGTLLSTQLFLDGLNTGRMRVWIAYAATLAMTAWAHLTIVFVAAAQGLIAVIAIIKAGWPARASWRPFAGLALAGWFTLHLYAMILPQMVEFYTRPGSGSTTAPVEWKNPIWLINETIRHLGQNLALGWLGILAAVCLLAWGFLRCARKDPLVTGLMVLPGLITLGVLILLGRNLWPRFFFNDFGFIAIVVMSGCVGAGQFVARLFRWNKSVVPLIPGILLCLASAVSLPRAYNPKQDFTGVCDFVRAKLQPEDRVFGIHMAGRMFTLYYAHDWAEINSLEELAAGESGSGRTWAIYTLPGHLKAIQPELMNYLDTHYSLAATFPGTLGDGTIIIRTSTPLEEATP